MNRALTLVATAACLLSSRSLAQSLDQQAKCGGEAQRAFTQDGYKGEGEVTREAADPKGDYDVTAQYESHYNPALNRCFMLLETQGVGHKNVGYQTKLLFDANERRVYADYLWMPKGGKKYWEVAPTVCRLTPSHTEELSCHSEAEFMEFVARYME